MRRRGTAGGPQGEPGAIDCVEQALDLLRSGGPRLAAAYLLGTVPFLLGLVYFWADMSRSASAPERLPAASLRLALLFAWMKCWHAVYASALRGRLTGEGPSPWSARRAARLAALQTAAQATGLVVLPVAALFALPLGWAVAFYQNLSVLGDGREGWRETVRRSWALARLWPAQNHRLLGVVSIFWLFVLLNVAVTLAAAPGLLRALAGVDVGLASGPWLVLNSTFLAVVLALSWLCVDPLLKATYALRCFYGGARRTGEDLRAQIRRFPVPGAALLALLLPALLLGAAPEPGRAAPAADAARELRGPLTPERLDRAIAQTVSREEYSWRLPRERPERAEEEGLLAEFLRGGLEYLVDGLRALGRRVERLVDWLAGLFSDNQEEEPAPRLVDFMGWRQALLLAVSAAAASLAGVWLWRRRRRPGEAGAESARCPVPDLARGEVAADRLPAEGWVALARELGERGEWRLCLRALYLAGLASLAGRDLVRLAAWKSNREYERELARAAAGERDLAEAFAAVVRDFERVWYGLHAADERLAREVARQLGRIVPGVAL